MYNKSVYVFVALIFTVFGKNVNHRNARYIGGTYTKVITTTQVVTSLVPSSCVFVDPTLPPCRSVRFLSFPQFDTVRNWFTNKSSIFKARMDKTETTQLGWGEYLGFYQPTVTVTELELQTTTVQDPRVAVTYAVKGCRPQKFPSDIDSCVVDTTSTIPILEILPTSTVAVPHTSSISTKIIQDFQGNDKTDLPGQQNKTEDVSTKIVPVLESSSTEESVVGTNSQQPTEPLSI